MRVLLIDGDMLCRRAAHGAEKIAADPDARARAAVKRVDAALDAVAAALRGDRLLAALGAGASFRARLWPGYKAARRGRAAPDGLAAARRRLAERVETRLCAGLEADDLLGIWASAPDLSFAAEDPRAARRRTGSGPRIIVSGDKDLLTAPGLHGSPSGRVWRVTPEEAETRHLLQTLTGDSADGYRGCPGVGPRRAAAILASAGAEPWPAILNAFARARLGPEAALLQARLARILRHGDVDPETRAPRLWSPDRLRGCGGPETLRRALAPLKDRWRLA